MIIACKDISINVGKVKSPLAKFSSPPLITQPCHLEYHLEYPNASPCSPLVGLDLCNGKVSYDDSWKCDEFQAHSPNGHTLLSHIECSWC
jgi:hypothetical protein